jgi:hypothetical protein
MGIYYSEEMIECQQTNVKKSRSYADRLIAGVILACIFFFFGVMILAEQGLIRPGYLLGVCGFKQRYGLPCPGCGWTHSAQAFAAGDVVRSFTLQPAASFFCGLLVIIAFLALHTLIFGIHSKLLRTVTNVRFWKYCLIGSGIIILLGWVVTLARALAARGGL